MGQQERGRDGDLDARRGRGNRRREGVQDRTGQHEDGPTDWNAGGSGRPGRGQDRRGGVLRERRPRYLPRDTYGDRRSSSGGWIIGIILLALIGLGVWYFLTQVGDANPVDAPASVSLTVSASASPAPPA